MIEIKRIIVSGDITRINDAVVHAKAAGPIINIHRLYGLIRHQLRHASGLPVAVFPEHYADTFFQRALNAQGISAPATESSWYTAYHANPTEAFLALMAEIYGDSLVIACELSPLMKKTFSLLSIPYIDVIMHPIRFYEQLILGFSSENEMVENILRRYALPSLSIHTEASYQQARYIPNVLVSPIPDNTLLIVGQKPVDKVLIKESGGVYSLLDFKEELEALIDKHDCVYFKPHPRGSEQRLIDWFANHEKVITLPHPKAPDINTYAYLSHPNIKSLAGLNSSLLVEGHFFGKQIINLAPFEFNFLHDTSSHFPCHNETSYPLTGDIFSRVAFWHDVLSCLMPTPSLEGWSDAHMPLPNLRLIFRGGGGNSFDDAQSYTQCCKIGALESKLSDVQRQQIAERTGSNAENPEYFSVPPVGKRLANSLVHVGCGKKHLPGYVGCDIRPTSVTSVVCPAWDIHKHFVDAREIYSRHMLEHLSYRLVERTLSSWFSALQVGGIVRILVPDIDEAISKWNEIKWTADEWRPPYSKAKHIMAQFWGWQTDQTSMTGQHEHGLTFWDVHKFGFTRESLAFFLRAAGFTEIEVIDAPFEIRACKRMATGERQVSMHLRDVRADHRGRYRYASTYLRPGMKVLDAACGVGYGSYLLSQAVPNMDITAVDIDTSAVQYGNEFYKNETISYVQKNILDCTYSEAFDAVTSFETLEHIGEEEQALRVLYNALKPGGRLFISTPNQNTLTFSPQTYPYHVRHHTPEEFVALLVKAGFVIDQLVSQPSKEEERVLYNQNGLYLLAVCSKINS
jgi:2-polyprenyl-3-methyl-5-hydroxy-6-metoxy-1,4-benzoquinol methylase